MTSIEHIRQLKDEGRTVIGCFPLYPPLELLHSMGLTPVVLWGLKPDVPATPESDRHLQNYTCSVARHLTEFLMSEKGRLLDGLFMYNAGDTLRNLPEIIERRTNIPQLRMHVPMTPPAQTDGSRYLKNEINRLIDKIEGVYGRRFDEKAFLNSLAQYDKYRDLCLRLETVVNRGRLGFQALVDVIMNGWFRPVERVCHDLRDLLERQAGDASSADTPGVFLSGILPPPTSVTNAIEGAGLRVTGNDIAALHRSYAAKPPAALDPAAYYVNFYYDHPACPTLLYSADRRVEELLDRVVETGAKGVIFVGEKFCEYEYFEFPFLEKKLREQGLATMVLEVAIEDDDHTAAHQGRIEAFAEMIHNSQ